MISILKPVTKPLVLLSLVLGHPFDNQTLTKSGGLVFKSSRYLYFQALAFSLIALSVYIVLPIFCSFSNASYAQMFMDLRRSGLAMTDIIGIETALILNSLIQPAFMIILASKSHLLTELCYRTLELNNVLNVKEVQIQLVYQQQRVVLIGIFILGFICSILFGGFSYGIVVRSLATNPSVLAGIMSFCSSFLSFASPNGISNQLISVQITNSIKTILQKWIENIDHFDNKASKLEFFSPMVGKKSARIVWKTWPSSNPPNKIEPQHQLDKEGLPKFEVVNSGLKIVGCIKLADMALGAILLKEITTSLFNFAISSYFICTIYSLFDGGEFHWVTPLFLASSLCMMIMSIWKIIYLTKVTEDLNQVVRRGFDAFQNYQMMFQDENDKNKANDLDLKCLSQQLRINNCYQPCGCFNLSFPTILAAIGLMTTYTIVLLQFKLSENN